MNKEFEKTVKYFKKNRGLIIKTIIPVVIFCLFVTIIGVLSPKPNDNITPSSNNYLFENHNPRFNVGFGTKDEPDKSYVRFEARTDTKNPFDEQESSIWNSLTRAFTGKKGFEFGLSEIRFSDTGSKTGQKLVNQIGSAIEQMEVKDVRTGTEVIEVGRLLGETEENNVSKKTVLNKDVYPGIDVEYQILEGLGVKEEIIIQNIDEYTANCGSNDTECLLPLNEFVFDLKLDEGVSIERYLSITKQEGMPSYYLVDDRDNYIAHFLPTFAVDYVGSKTYAVDLVINHIEENNYEVVVTMNLDWLFSSDRVFPIRIDPSIVHDTTVEFDTGSDYNTEVVTGPKVQLQDQEVYNLDDNVVGYWKLNESSGSGSYIKDISGNGYDGTPTNTTYTDGKFRGGRQFVTTVNKITIGDIATFEVPIFAIEAYIKKEGSCNYNHCTIVSKGSTGFEGFNFGVVGSTPVLQVRINDGGSGATQVLNGSTTISNDTWYHVAAVVDTTSDVVYLYLDGKLDGTDSFTEAISYGAADVKIGNANDTDDLGFNGVVDEVRFSRVERTPEEISDSYISKTQGSHTSALLEMPEGEGAEVETITWSSVGNHTGGGEIPYSTTGLLGQWNFNEASGITADNEGSCGSSCDGTLTSFSNTTGQDVAVGSGWTSDNRRWGEGALMFDGKNDYIEVTDNGDFDFERTDNFTIGAWINSELDSVGTILAKMGNSGTYQGYDFLLGTDGSLKVHIIGTWDTSALYVTGTRVINDGRWHYVVMTYDGTSLASGINLYVDGVPEKTNMAVAVDNLSTSIVQNNPVTVGSRDGGVYFKGIIDSVKIYSRVLNPTEILSNYQSGNIEMRYRTSNNGSTWSDWNGGTETSIEDFENEYLYDVDDSGLVAYYSMDESSGTAVEDVTTNTNDGTASGTVVVEGKHGDSRSFNGSSDYISVPAGSGTSLDIDSNPVTLEAWIKPNSLTEEQHIISRGTRGTEGYGLAINYDPGFVSVGLHGASNFAGTTTLQVGEWYHIVGIVNGSSSSIYVNGKLDSTGTVDIDASDLDMHIGSSWNGTAEDYFFDGDIDEVRIYNGTLTSTEIHNHWLEGSLNPSTVRTQSISNSIEGNNALEISSKGPSIDHNTVGYWKLEESSGAGAYIKDSSSNGNDGTPTGTTYVKDGRVGGAREFDGVDDWIDLGNLGDPSEGTIEFWVNLDNSNNNLQYLLDGRGTGNWWILQDYTADSCTDTEGNICFYGLVEIASDKISEGLWHHIAVTVNSTESKAYIDGVLADIGAGFDPDFSSVRIGTRYTNSGWLDGSMDEVRISNITRTAEEIYESYNLGKNKYISETIDTTDLSAHTTLPFWVASDEIGSNMDLMYGESEYANYEPDENTVGLWHLDEEQPGAQVSDSSGNGNDGVLNPNGFRYTRYDNACTAHPLTHTALIACFNEGTLYANTTATSSQTAINIADDYTSMLSTWMHVSEPGSWLFAIDGDDAVEIEVDGTVVASYYNGHGFIGNQTYNGSTTLNRGWHKVNIRHEEVAGGDGVVAYVRPPGVGTWSVFSTSSVAGYATLHSYNATNTEVQLANYIEAGLQSYPPGSFTDGVIGGARSFNGSSDRISLPSTSFPSGEEITISFWAYGDSSQLPVYNSIFEAADSSGNRACNIHLPWSDETVYWDCGNSGTSFNRIYRIVPSSYYEGKWTHWAFTKDAGNGTMAFYIDGKLWHSGTGLTYNLNPGGAVNIGTDKVNNYHWPGMLDEFRIDDVARTPDQIRQAYEVGRRTHPIKVDFKASLESSNLISSSGDTSFTISEQDYGTSDHIENIDVGEKIIVKENVGGTEYITQGDLSTVNTSTGAVTVSSWDSGSTFPTSGFTVNATVFKWQREYVDIRYPLDEDIDAITRLTFRKTTDVSATFWIDDVKKATYSSDYNASSFTPIEEVQYIQYQPIFTKWDDNPLLDLYLTQVSIDYTSGPTMEQVMRHGKWFNSSGEQQPFWWVGEE